MLKIRNGIFFCGLMLILLLISIWAISIGTVQLNLIDIQKALIGIGAKKAEAIVQYREKHGNFTAAEQLLEVQGIGKATLEKNRDRIAF